MAEDATDSNWAKAENDNSGALLSLPFLTKFFSPPPKDIEEAYILWHIPISHI